jgi:hypothetical protein
MKRYRIYFNRMNDVPLVWSVDEGDQASEINVREVRIFAGQVSSCVNLGETDAENRPKAWLEVDGELRIEDGIAKIYGPIISKEMMDAETARISKILAQRKETHAGKS